MTNTPANSSHPATGAIPLVHNAAPDLTGRQIAMAIFALSIGGFAIGVTEFAMMGLQREAVADLNISISQGGQLVAAYAIGVVVGAPFLALMGAKRERRNYVLALLAVFLIAHVLSFFAPNYETMLAARFLSGLPHGAYFGTAALMAAHMVGPAKRARAISVVLSGIAVANLSGVPVVTWLGQTFGWRWMYITVAVLAGLTMLAVAVWTPKQQPPEGASVRGELRALKNQRLWVGIGLAVVGFSGMFALYSYIAHISTDVAGLPASALPWVVFLYGLGSVIGNFAGGWFTDKSVLGTVFFALVGLTVLMTAFSLTAQVPLLMVTFLFLVGASASALSPAMQTHLIDTAPNAPQLSASFHHSAFNAANALGAVLGGAVIAAGWGLRAPSIVGAIAAFLGVLICVYAIHLTRKAGQKV